MRTDDFNEVGGLSQQFPNCFNDVDLGFKILNAGYRIIWAPHARLCHFESASRNTTVDKRELEMIKDRWGNYSMTTGFAESALSYKGNNQALQFMELSTGEFGGEGGI